MPREKSVRGKSWQIVCRQEISNTSAISSIIANVLVLRHFLNDSRTYMMTPCCTECMTSMTAHMKIPWGLRPIWMRLKALSTRYTESSWSKSSDPSRHASLIKSVQRNEHCTSGLSRLSKTQSHDRWCQGVLLWWLFVRQHSWSPCLPSLITKSKGQMISTTVIYPVILPELTSA